MSRDGVPAESLKRQGGSPMIKVTVLYPADKGSKFDIDYYCNKHMPMVQQKLGTACKRSAVEHEPRT